MIDTAMEEEQIQTLLDNIGHVKIAVLGDFCLDAYWFIDESKSEISIETGLATRPVREQRYSPGGAGNVTNNLAAMGVKDIRAIGVTGPDPFGPELIRIMNRSGICTDYILQQDDNWSTHVYVKPCVKDREEGRIDFGNFNRLSEKTADRLIEILDEQAGEADVVIINQQVPSGIHTEYLRNGIVRVIQNHPDKIFIVDSRDFSDFYTGSCRKLNDHEAIRLCGIQRGPDEPVPRQEALDAALTLYQRFQKPLFITRGGRGSLIADENGISEIRGLLVTSRIDPVGAGDSYLAGAASALAAGYPMPVAAELGSLVAGVTVQKLFQTGTASPDEILQLGATAEYIESPELAENVRMASYFPGSEIEIIRHWKKDVKIFHAIFDHDGTLSTLREGWEEIMAPMMIKAILGDQFKQADEALFRKVQTRVNAFIDRTTGIQTLVQMKGLLDLIREFGIVPENRILDEFGYKQIYNEELLKMVREREDKLKRGELSREDLSVKNAIPFLQKLADAGVRLYLASGTDEEDVRDEARVMGYAHLFEGRIYGAVGDVNKEAKKMVLDRILDSIGNAAFDQVVTFGDGPVEIRETRKKGGRTVGVASNELRRFGLNERKRTRLIKSGADVIVPDFSQMDWLLNFLNI
ncbi:MAG: PfkB family carbohydrate kinase [Mangrovibacterium sp.]|nr:PfkB family carbohydrate kinase [Mangrovibacterium sp.]